MRCLLRNLEFTTVTLLNSAWRDLLLEEIKIEEIRNIPSHRFHRLLSQLPVFYMRGFLMRAVLVHHDGRFLVCVFSDYT